MMSHLKIAVVGSEGVGKTSLVTRFCGEEFEFSHEPTVSMSVREVSLSDGDDELRGQFWEPPSGDSVAHERAYEGAMGVVIVYDVTRYESFVEATTTLYHQATQFAANSFILLLGCKTDLVGQRVVQVREAEDFASRVNCFFMEASNADNTNIELTLTILRIRAVHTLRARQTLFDAPAEETPASLDRHQQLQEEPGEAEEDEGDDASYANVSHALQEGLGVAARSATLRGMLQATGVPASAGADDPSAVPPVSTSYDSISAILGRSPGSGLVPSAQEELSLLGSPQRSSLQAFAAEVQAEGRRLLSDPSLQGSPSPTQEPVVSEGYEALKAQFASKSPVKGKSPQGQGGQGGQVQALRSPQAPPASPLTNKVVEVDLTPTRGSPITAFGRAALPLPPAASARKTPKHPRPNLNTPSRLHQPTRASVAQRITSPGPNSPVPSPSASASPGQSPGTRRISVLEAQRAHYLAQTGASKQRVSAREAALRAQEEAATAIGSGNNPISRTPSQQVPRRGGGGGWGAAKGKVRAAGAFGAALTRAAAPAHAQEPPMVVIDVNIGDGRTGHIEVRHGDNAFFLAETFVNAHELPGGAATARRLAELVRDRVDAFVQDQERQEQQARGRATVQEAQAWKHRATVPQEFKFASEARAAQKRSADRGTAAMAAAAAAASSAPATPATVSGRGSRGPVVGRLHVEVARGVTGTIVVKEDDDVEELLSQFKRTFHGKAQLRPTQIDRLREQIRNTLGRPHRHEDEEESDDEEEESPLTPAQQALLQRALGGAAPPPPPPPASSPPSDRKPIFNLDVDIGGGRGGRITVREGDSTEGLAVAFAREHGLPSSAAAKVRQLLDANMAAHV